MPIFFNANYRGLAILGMNIGVARSVMDAAVKYAFFRVAMFWHRVILPQHFEKGARRKYKHQKRKKAYSAIKRAFALGKSVLNTETGLLERYNVVKGGLVDIAFEGHTEMRSRQTRAIRATRAGFVLKMRVPRYIMGRRRGDFPNMRRELSYITTEEAMLLGRVWWREASRFLKANQVNQTLSV